MTFFKNFQDSQLVFWLKLWVLRIELSPMVEKCLDYFNIVTNNSHCKYQWGVVFDRASWTRHNFILYMLSRNGQDVIKYVILPIVHSSIYSIADDRPKFVCIQHSHEVKRRSSLDKNIHNFGPAFLDCFVQKSNFL